MIPPSAAPSAPGNPTDDSKPQAHRNPEHHKGITMADIAKAAGVSQGAISSLLNDRDYGIRVSEKTRERVFRVCRDMGYIPNDLRAVVRMYPELGDFCVLLSSDLGELPSDPFQTRVISGAMAAITEAVTIARYRPDIDYISAATDPELLPQPVKSGTTSKFLLLGMPNASLCQLLVARGFGVALAGHEVALAGVTSILPDFAGASEAAIDHLFKLGHKRMAILSGPFGSTDYQIIELNRGVRAAFDKANVAIEAQNIIYGDLTMEAGYKALDLLMERSDPPTAIFCFHDAAAAGVIARAQARGIQIPDQLSVIGCSDDALSAHLQRPQPVSGGRRLYDAKPLAARPQRQCLRAGQHRGAGALSAGRLPVGVERTGRACRHAVHADQRQPDGGGTADRRHVRARPFQRPCLRRQLHVARRRHPYRRRAGHLHA